MGQEPDIGRLRDAAMRLAAELDGARLYLAAAYASMAVDAIPFDAPQDRLRQARDDPLRRRSGQAKTGSGRAGRSGGRVVPDAADIDLDFTLDGQDRVWMIREGDCHMIGRTDAVCAEMRRFLAGVVAEGDGYV